MVRNYTDEQIEQSIVICKQLSWKFAKGNYELYEEYLSESYIGATKALNGYNENIGIKFSTYCAKCVKNQLFMLFREYTKNKNIILLNEDDRTFDNLTDKSNMIENIIINDLIDSTKDYVKHNFPKAKKKVLLCKLNNLDKNDTEVADILGVSRQYVNKTLKDSKEKIRRFVYKI